MTEVVYVLGGPGSNIVKIGRSTNVRKRLAAIRAMSPLPLEVLCTSEGGVALEAVLHQTFADRRRHGEWFEFDSSEAAVEEIAAAVRTHHLAEAARETGERMTAEEILAELRELVRRRNEANRNVARLVAQARAERPAVAYAELEEITGLSREWLRKIARGVAGARRPRRATESTAEPPATHRDLAFALPPARVTELVDHLRHAPDGWYQRTNAACARTDPDNIGRAVIALALDEGVLTVGDL